VVACEQALSGRLRELKNKGKSPLVIHKSGRDRGRGRLQEDAVSLQQCSKIIPKFINFEQF